MQQIQCDEYNYDFTVNDLHTVDRRRLRFRSHKTVELAIYEWMDGFYNTIVTIAVDVRPH